MTIEAVLRETGQVALLTIAAVLFARSWSAFQRFRLSTVQDPQHNVLLLRGFRSAVVALALIGFALAWALDETWILLLTIAIGGVETLESSALLFGLTRGASLRLRP